MAVSIKIVFRKDKVNAQGKAPLYVRLTKDRKTSYHATDVRIEEKYWDNKGQKVRPSHPNSKEANNLLFQLRQKVHDGLYKQQSENTGLSSRALKDKILGGQSASFYEVAEGLLRRYKANGKIGTHDKCKSIVNKIKHFTKSDNLKLQEIDHQFLTRYEEYCRTKLHNRTNTVHKDFKFMRRIFNAAYKQGLIEHNQTPFHRYEIKTEKVTREHLTEEELNKLDQLQLDAGSRLELHRDMFIFASYTGGLRVSDVLLLKWGSFTGTHLDFTIRKTSTQHSIKLPTRSLTIIQKYQPAEQDSQGFIFPMLPADLNMDDLVEVDRRITSCTAYINKNLKILAKKAGIDKNIHFHISRHTWACLALQKGMGIEHVSKLMAHSSIRETQVYAKLVSRELDAAMDKFNL